MPESKLRKEATEPPLWPLRIIRRLVRSEYLEEIEGDMIEEFHYHVEKYSLKRAKYLYTRELIKVLRTNLLHKFLENQKLNSMGTFIHYVKIAFRNLRKHRVYSSIKIGGFSIGIAISLLICLFVREEIKVDRHLAEKPIYKILYKSDRPDRAYRSVSVPPVLAPSLKKDYLDVRETGRILVFDGFGDAGGNLFRPADQQTSIYEEKFGYADQSIIKMLDFKLVYGDAATALAEPFTMIISDSKAQKYFPDEDPTGKVVYINENLEQPYVIKGVYQDLVNSHLRSVDFFFTLSGKEFWRNEQTSWCCYNYLTFIELEPGTSESAFRAKLKSIHDNYFVTYEKDSDPKYAELIEEHNTLDMQHVADVYLHSKDIYTFLALGDVRIVTAFGAIAFFILLLACMNFVNLTTANSAQRSREIGLRKAVGSGRSGVMQQFLIEAEVLSVISVILGASMAWLSMPFFNQIVGKTIVFPYGEPLFYLLLAAFSIIIGLVSGIYPALYLSGIKAISVLGGQLKISGSGQGRYLRSTLVVFQFAISMFLIIGAVIVYKQMSHILNRDLGYSKDQVLMVHGTGTMQEQTMKTFREELENLPEVVSLSMSNSLPVEGTHRNGNMFWKEGMKNIEEGIAGQFWRADDNYFETLGLTIQQGRPFSNELASDSISVVINEAMAEQLGLDDPVDAYVENWGKWKVVGVVKNFNFDHLKEDIRPLLIARTRSADLMAVKIQANDIQSTVAKIDRLWESMNPKQAIRLSFLDQRFEAMYEEVTRTRTIFLAFAVFALIVACLGLTGLSIYTVAVRTKEITIRKVLGASVQTLLRLLTFEYLKLVLLSMVFAMPLAWFVAQGWLEDFSYRIPQIWDAFLLGAVVLILVAAMVVSFQSIRAALSNPATGLRDE